MRFFKLPYLLSAVLLLVFGWIGYRLYSGRVAGDKGQTPAVDGLVSSTGPIATDRQTSDQAAGLEAATGAGAGGSEPTQDGHPLDPLLAYAREIKQHIEEHVVDYSAVLIKRERIGGALGPENKMQIKIRNRNANANIPLSAYIHFLEPKSVKGREVIWVEKANGDKLISHEAGMLNIKRIKLAPDGMLAMAGNKYPITEVGLLRLTEKLIEKGERDRQLGDCVVDVLENQRVGERKCRLYQITHPQPASKFDFHIAQIFVDVERKIPLRYAAFLWPTGDEPPPLEEEYTYLDLEMNQGFTETDFDPDNPDYNFPSF